MKSRRMSRLGALFPIVIFLEFCFSSPLLWGATTTLSLGASTDKVPPGQEFKVVVNIGPISSDNPLETFEVTLEVSPQGTPVGSSPKIKAVSLGPPGFLFSGFNPSNTPDTAPSLNPEDSSTWSTLVRAQLFAVGQGRSTETGAGLLEFTLAVPPTAVLGDVWKITISQFILVGKETPEPEYSLSQPPNELTLTIACPIVITTPGNITTVPITHSLQLSALQDGLPITVTAWKVNGIVGGDATVGIITSTGLYTAPSNLPPGGTVTITAETTLCPADLILTILPIEVTISLPPNAPPTLADPRKRYLRSGQTAQFLAQVSNTEDQTVAWSVVSGTTGGVMDPVSGIFTTAQVSQPVKVTIRATSRDAGQIADFAFTVRPAITIGLGVITPVPGTTQTNTDRPLRINVSVSNVAEGELAGVDWTVVSGTGAVSSEGVFTPDQPGTVRLRATSQQSVAEGNPVSRELEVIVKPPVSVTLVNPVLQIAKNVDTTYTAEVANFLVEDRVNWELISAPEGTTLSTTGPSKSVSIKVPVNAPAGASFILKATSVDDPRKSAQVNLSVVEVQVDIQAPSSVLKAGQNLQFFAFVTPDYLNQTVEWSIKKEDGSPGVPEEDGTIDTAGLYQAPAGPFPDHNVRVSAFHPLTGILGFKTLRLIDVRITALEPDPISQERGVRAGGPALISATVENSNRGISRWEVVDASGNPVTGKGTFAFDPESTDAIYIAPENVPAEETIVIRATTTELSRTATVSLVIRPAITLHLSGPKEINSDRGPVRFTAEIPAVALRPGETDDVVFFLGGDEVQGDQIVTEPDGNTGVLTLALVPDTGTTPRTLTIAARSLQSVAEEGEANAVVGSATLTVKPPIRVTVSGPERLPRLGGGQFTASLENLLATDTGKVTWYVGSAEASVELVQGQLSLNGFVQGGNSTLGTIDSTGLYTAPVVEQDTTLKILAVSTDDPRKFGLARVTVFPLPTLVVVSPVSAQPGESVPLQVTVLHTEERLLEVSPSGAVDNNVFPQGIGTVTFDTNTGIYRYNAPSVVVGTPQTLKLKLRIQGATNPEAETELTVNFPTVSIALPDPPPGEDTDVDTTHHIARMPLSGPSDEVDPLKWKSTQVFRVSLENGGSNGVEWELLHPEGRVPENHPSLGQILTVPGDPLSVRYVSPEVSFSVATENLSQNQPIDAYFSWRVRLQARSKGDPSKVVAYDIEILPYGDGALTAFREDNQVTLSDAVQIYRWSLGRQGARPHPTIPNRFIAPTELLMRLVDTTKLSLFSASKRPWADGILTVLDAFWAYRKSIKQRTAVNP